MIKHARARVTLPLFFRSEPKRFLNLCLHGFFYESKCLFLMNEAEFLFYIHRNIYIERNEDIQQTACIYLIASQLARSFNRYQALWNECVCLERLSAGVIFSILVNGISMCFSRFYFTTIAAATAAAAVAAANKQPKKNESRIRND